MKKIFKLFIAFTMIFAAFPMMNVSAKENEMIEVKMLNYCVDTDYNTDDYYVVYRDDYENNKYLAEIFERKTNEKVQVYSEKPEIPLKTAKKIADGTSLTKAKSTYDSTWDTTYTIQTINKQKISAYVWTRVNITADFSWRQVNKVLSSGHSAGGSGYYSLIPAGTFCNTKTFPCGTNLAFQINGIIEISKTQSTSAGFSFKLLESLGFDMSGSSSSTWYARKSYNNQVTFKVM
jgi:hypothetical protein